MTEIETAQFVAKSVFETQRHIEEMDKKSNLVRAHWANLYQLISASQPGVKGMLLSITGFDAKLKSVNDYVQQVFTRVRDTTGEYERVIGLLETFKPRGFDLFASTFAGFIGSVLHDMGKMNKSLIEANGLLEDRRRVMHDVLVAQTLTGSSLDVSLQAARSLTRYGLESSTHFQSTTATVIKMNQALGISTDLGAELAFIFDSKLKVGTIGVADAVTRIVDETALLADEAGKFASELGRAMLFLRADIRDPLGATRFLGRLEGAIKEAAGVPGEVTRVISESLSSFEGAVRVMRLGAMPQNLAQAGGERALIERLTQLARPGVEMARQGNIAGLEQLRVISEVFTESRISVQTLRALVETEDVRQKQRVSGLTLEQKWREEMKLSNDAWEAAVGSVRGLIRQALMPIIPVINSVISLFKDVIQWFAKFKTTAVILTSTMVTLGVVTLGYGIKRLIELTSAIFALGQMARRTTVQLAEAALAQQTTFGFMRGGGGAVAQEAGFLARMTSWVPKVLGVIFSGTSAAILAAGLAGIGLGQILKKIFPSLKELWPAARITMGEDKVGQLVRQDIRSLLESRAVPEEFLKHAQFATSRMRAGTAGEQARIGNILREYQETAAKVIEMRSAELQVQAQPPTRFELEQLNLMSRQLQTTMMMFNAMEEDRKIKARALNVEEKKLDNEEKARTDAIIRQQIVPKSFSFGY